MVFDISGNEFKSIFADSSLYLPIRWDGKDFPKTLCILYDNYLEKVREFVPQNYVKDIHRDCKLILAAINHYLEGFPDKAYGSMETLMNRMITSGAGRYFQTIIGGTSKNTRIADKPLRYFRVASVPDNQPYPRERVFHTPYTMRSKVSTNRYSIAGFPSLYLGTSLELCCEEVHFNPHSSFSIASRFEPNVDYKYENKPISFIDLAIKPQDFITQHYYNDNTSRRIVDYSILENHEIKYAYLSWYPLVAACSFIRVNKNDPFAAEYIVPQLLMQWARSEMQTLKNSRNQLVGIRYFSCSSIRASDMGFNYVFPTSGTQGGDTPYCPVLSNAFLLTEPHYIHEYLNLRDCENALIKDTDLQKIM